MSAALAGVAMSMTTMTRLEELQRRVQRDPASISFAALAEEYRRLGLFQETIDVCRAGLQRHPAYLSARVTLGRALLEIGEFDGATRELEFVLQTAPENLAAIRALAEIHRRRTEMPESLERFASTDDAMPADGVQSSISQQAAPLSAVDEAAISVLEEFLASIQRARRDLTVDSIR
jgi:tetratricopeptide (TPR) repeat protein